MIKSERGIEKGTMRLLSLMRGTPVQMSKYERKKFKTYTDECPY